MSDPAGRRRFGLPEYGLSAALVAVALVTALAFWAGFPVVVLPAIGVALIFGLAYGLHRLNARETAGEAADPPAAQAARPAPAVRLAPVPLPVLAVFRVVGARGVACPRGCGVGQAVSVDARGETSPRLCQPAEAVLRMAASGGSGETAREWCCPIYDHMLVFREERAQEARAA